MKGLLGKAAREKRTLDESEREKCDTLTGELEALESTIKAEEKQLAWNRDQAPAVRWPDGEGPRDRAPIAEDEPALSALPPMPQRRRPRSTGCSLGCHRVPRPGCAQQFRSAVIAALNGHPDVLAASQNETEGISGGFTVPTEVAREIFRRALEASVWVRAGCRVEPMLTDEKVIAAWDDSDETNDAEAAVVAHWTSESETMTPQVARMRAVTLHAKKLTCLAACSSELVEDAPNFLPALEQVLSGAIAKKFDRSVLTGGGAAEPLGVLTSAATVSVAKETAPAAQIAATIVWPNITKMWASLAPGLHETSVWLAHPTTLPQLLNLQVRVLNAAGNDYVGGGLPAIFESGSDGSYRLLGRPLYITSRVKVLGQPGDLILFAPSEVAVGIRSELQLARSADAYFTTDEIAVRARFRGDARRCGTRRARSSAPAARSGRRSPSRSAREGKGIHTRPVAPGGGRRVLI